MAIRSILKHKTLQEATESLEESLVLLTCKKEAVLEDPGKDAVPVESTGSGKKAETKPLLRRPARFAAFENSTTMKRYACMPLHAIMSIILQSLRNRMSNQQVDYSSTSLQNWNMSQVYAYWIPNMLLLYESSNLKFATLSSSTVLCCAIYSTCTSTGSPISEYVIVLGGESVEAAKTRATYTSYAYELLYTNKKRRVSDVNILHALRETFNILHALPLTFTRIQSQESV